MKKNKNSAGPRDGEVRCMACAARFRPEAEAEQAACPKCGIQWRISWPYPKIAKVRGPVWDSFPGGRDK